MNSLKIICILALPALAAVFVYQNTAVMKLKFLFWSVAMSTSLIVLAAFLAGFIVGLLLCFLSSRRKGSKTRVENMR